MPVWRYPLVLLGAAARLPHVLTMRTRNLMIAEGAERFGPRFIAIGDE